MNTVTAPTSLLGRLAGVEADNPLLKAAHHPQPHQKAGRDAVPTSMAAAAIGVQDSWQGRLSQTLTFELTTREGDRVQVSVRQKLGAMQQTTLVAAGASDGQNTALVGSLSQLQAGRFDARIGIHVQGNLNDDELKALQDVMQQVGKLAQAFFSGDMQTAVDDLNNMHFDTAQVAGFDLSMHQRVQVRHSQQVAAQVYQQTVRPQWGRGPVHPQVQQLRVQQWHEQMVTVEQSLSAHFRFASTSVEGMMAALSSDASQDPDKTAQLIKQLRQQMAELLGIKPAAADEAETREKRAEKADGADTAQPAASSQPTAAPSSAPQPPESKDPMESSAARAEANTPRPETSTA